MFHWCDSENLQVQTCSSEQYNASHVISLSSTQHPVLKYLNQQALYTWNCTSSPTAAVGVSAAEPSLFLFSVSQKCLDCGNLAFRTLRVDQSSRLLQLYSTPQLLPCCVGLCFLIFSVSAKIYRCTPCTLMLLL